MLASAGRGKDSMSTITIYRERGYYDLARSYQVFVDGDLAGEVGYGGKLTVAATPGKHSVQLKIDWCRSPEVMVLLTAGDTVALDCGNSAGVIDLIFYITIWRSRYLWLRFAGPSTH
jgi:hypothetical protein